MFGCSSRTACDGPLRAAPCASRPAIGINVSGTSTASTPSRGRRHATIAATPRLANTRRNEMPHAPTHDESGNTPGISIQA